MLPTLSSRTLMFVLLLLAGDAEIVASEAERHTLAGDAELAAGNAAAAAARYRAAITADPRAFEARVNLGAALLGTGDVRGAVESLEAARKTRPESGPLLRNLGRAYLRMDRYEDAANVLREALESGNHPDAARLLGIALHRSGDEAGAIPRLRKWVADHPDDLEVLVELARAQTGAGNLDAARATLETARKRMGPARSSGDVELSRVRNEMGLLLRRQGRAPDALGEFRAAARLDPASPFALGNLGMALLEAGETTEAIRTLVEASKRDPDPQLRYYLGLARLSEGDAKNAIADLEVARSRGFDPSRVSSALADAYKELGEEKRARSERSRAEASPGLTLRDSALQKAREGVDFLDAGRWSDAASSLGIAAKAQPENGVIQYNLGLARLRSGDAAGAEAPLLEASRRLPGEAAVWYQLAEARRERGDRQGAVTAWRRVLDLSPSRSDVAFSLGHALLELGRARDALTWLLRASKGLPDSPEVQYDLASALLRLGEDTRALAPLSAYLAARAGDHEAREVFASALFRSGRTTEAIREYQRLGGEQPEVSRHRVNLAVALRKAGDRAGEKAAWIEAARLAPYDSQVLSDLGRIHFADQEWGEAAATFARAAALDPGNQEAAKNADTARKNLKMAKERASRLHLGVIVAKSRAEALDAHRKITKGLRPFKELAPEISTHESASQGGDLGWVDPDTLPDWASEAKKLEPGTFSDVIEVPDGFAIFHRYPAR